MNASIPIRLTATLVGVVILTILGHAAVPPIQTSVGSRNDSLYDSVSAQANDGQIIDSIVIENRNIYDTKDPRYSGFLFRAANSLHYVSRPFVIRRELLFQPGDKFSSEAAEETARNLRTRYYLHDAWVETIRLPNGHLIVKIVTIDQWSLVGGFELNREGNETQYKIGFEERNLLGMNQFLSLDYVVQEADHNYVQWIFRESRFLGFPYSLSTEFNSDPHDERFFLGLGKPFYNLDQNLSYGFRIGTKGGRRDVFQDTLKIGQWRSSADDFETNVEYRWGGHVDKISLKSGYRYYNVNISEEQGTGISFPTDSLYHQPELGFAITHSQFIRVRRIMGFSYLEDFTLNAGFDISGGRAFRSGFKGYYYDRVDFQAFYGRKLDSSLLFLDYTRSYWFKGGDHLRRYNELVARYYNTSLNWMTIASRFMYRSDRSSLNEFGVTLGGTAGLRGYDEVARTGDRMAVLNVESRLYPNIEFLSIIFGGVLFTDIGRAWKSEESIDLHDLEYSFGAGLRISLEKATKSELIRIDASLTRHGDWAVAFGTGQYF